MKQQTFGAANFEKYGKQTRKGEFLEEMNTVIPWQDLVDAVDPYYPQPQGAGRRPVGIDVALAVVLMLAGCGGGSKTASMDGVGQLVGSGSDEPSGGGGGGGSRGLLLDRIDALYDSNSFNNRLSIDSTTYTPVSFGSLGTVGHEGGKWNPYMEDLVRPSRIDGILEDADYDYARQRFSGTATLRAPVPPPKPVSSATSYPSNFWGGWTDNTIFIVESTEDQGVVHFGRMGDWMLDEDFGDFGDTSHTIGPSSPFALSAAYSGQAVDSKGNWATATLNLSLTNYYGRAIDDVDDPTATLSLDFSTGHGQINFPPIRLISSSNDWSGSQKVYADSDNQVGLVGDAEPSYYYAIDFTPYEEDPAGRAEIAGYFRRLHIRKQDPDNEDAFEYIGYGDRSKDIQGVFGVTPDP